MLAQDVIYVGGGNTANMLAIWRVHGFDAILRDAWEHGVVLAGWSAGMICWFEAGVTDSFGPQLAAMRDGLGFLAGQRLPALRRRGAASPALPERSSTGGFPPGYAADDGVGLHFVGDELRRGRCRTRGRNRVPGRAGHRARSAPRRLSTSGGRGAAPGTRRPSCERAKPIQIGVSMT